MSPSLKKRKAVDLVEEDDDRALRVRDMEMRLQKMMALMEELSDGALKNVEKSDALAKSLMIEAKELYKANASSGAVDDDSSDDETVIEPIKDEGDKRWITMFQQLRDYRITNGDCSVPQKFRENPKLGNWVRKQKEHYSNAKKKGGKFKPNRIAMLEGLGFNWGNQFPPPESWDDMFAKLKTYKERMGDCNVPFNSTNPSPLARWVANQRIEYKRVKKGSDYIITMDQIGMLNDIGIIWKSPKK